MSQRKMCPREPTPESVEELSRICRNVAEDVPDMAPSVRMSLRNAAIALHTFSTQLAPDAVRACVGALRQVAELENGQLPNEVFRAVDRALEMVDAAPPQADAEALLRDARRYRWIRDQKHADIAACWLLPAGAEVAEKFAGTDLDAAIDAAIAAQEKP